MENDIYLNMDALRDALIDYCLSAAFAGMSPALIDADLISKADEKELLSYAERLRIVLSPFISYGE